MTADLDLLTLLVGRRLGAPMVCLSLLDEQRHLRTSSVGVPPSIGLIVSWSLAKHVADSSEPLVVNDAKLDPRIAKSPGVRDGAVAAYLGVRLITADGRTVGTLSVMDPTPRPWTPSELAFVQRVCKRVVRAVDPGTTVAEA